MVEAALKESESRLATIFKNDPSEIILVNSKTRTLHDANQTAVEMIGLQKRIWSERSAMVSSALQKWVTVQH